MPVIVEGELKEVYPAIKTVRELKNLILSSPAAKEVGEGIAFAIGYSLVMHERTDGSVVSSEKELSKPITEKFCI